MDRLPEELVSYAFTFLAAANSLSPAMLVNQQWYMYGARNLHHRVVLNLAPGLTVSSTDTAISFMKRLVSPTLSTAHFIHHLVLSGFANLDVQELILNILGRASALRSLNMHSLHIIPGGIWIPPDVFSSDVFLPNLIALNTSSVQFCARLCRDRRLTSIRIHEKIGSTHLDQLLSPARHSAPKLERLELVVAVNNASSAVARMAELASALATAPLCALSLQFILDHPGPVPWIEFERAIGEMGSSLRALPDLRSLSLAIRPDPLIPASNNAEAEPGDPYRELLTKGLAERLVGEHGLVWLRRIELRWHGWIIRDGEWISLPRTQLLRLPHAWLFDGNSGAPY